MERKGIKQVVIVSCTVLALTLLYLQLGFSNLVFAVGTSNDDVSMNFISTVNQAKTKEIITVQTSPKSDAVTVTSIELPNGTRVEDQTASYEALENGTVTFKVYYQVQRAKGNNLFTVSGSTQPNHQEEQHQEQTFQVKGIQMQGQTVSSSALEAEPNQPIYNLKKPIKDTSSHNETTLEPISAFSKSSLKSPILTDATITEGAFTFDFRGNIMGYDVAKGGTDVKIPTTYGRGMFVRTINANVFAGKGITSVTFQKDSRLTQIGNRTFSNNELISIALPPSITYIGAEAFAYNCLKTIAIMPNSPAATTKLTINQGVFKNNFIESVNFSSDFNNRIKKISSKAFMNNSIHFITIPDDITSIGDYAFASNGSKNANIGAGVKSIGAYAFSANKIQSMVIPNNVTSIGDYAFEKNCLLYLEIPESVHKLGKSIMNNQTVSSMQCNSGSLGQYVVDLWTYGITLGFHPNFVTDAKGVTAAGSPLSNFKYDGNGKFTFDEPDKLPAGFSITFQYNVKNSKVTSTGPNTVKLNNFRTFCVVTFDPQGGILAPGQQTQKILQGFKVNGVPTPTNPYNDQGESTDTANLMWIGAWYKDPACTQKFDPNREKINKNITLYTKWIPKNNHPQAFLEIPSGIKLYDFDQEGYAKGKGEISLKVLDGNVQWYENYIFHVKPTQPTLELTSTSPISKDKFTVELVKPDNAVYDGTGDFINLNVMGNYGCPKSAKFTLRTPLDNTKRQNIEYAGTLSFTITLENKD